MFNLTDELNNLTNTLDELIAKQEKQQLEKEEKEILVKELSNKFKSMVTMLLVKDPEKWCLIERSQYIKSIEAKLAKLI